MGAAGRVAGGQDGPWAALERRMCGTGTDRSPTGDLSSLVGRCVRGRQDRAGGEAHRQARAKTKAPAEAGAFIAAGFAHRKGIFHARFPALP